MARGQLHTEVIGAKGLPSPPVPAVTQPLAAAFVEGAGAYASPAKGGRGKKRGHVKKQSSGNIPPPGPAEGGLGAEIPKPTTYVTVAVKGDGQSTGIAHNTANPHYGGKFTHILRSAEADQELVFTVFAQTPGSGDMPLCLATVTLTDVWAGALSSPSDLPLKTSDGAPAGTLKVLATWRQSRTAPAAAAAENAKGAAVEAPAAQDERDFIERNLVKLTGPRPGLLRVESYYAAMKIVYGTVVGLPIVNKIAPIFEGVLENVLSRTPLKPQEIGSSPEESQAAEGRRTVDSIDRRIEDALTGVDKAVDNGKDAALERLVHFEKAVKNIKPKDKSIVEATVDGVFFTAGAARDTVVGTAVHAADSVQGFIGGIFGKVQETAGAAINAVTTTASNATNAVGSAADGVKKQVVGAAQAAGDVAAGAVGSVVHTAGGAVDAVKSKAGLGGPVKEPPKPERQPEQVPVTGTA